MFVVRRPFRDTCGMRQAGSVVDPASVKRFRYRLQERHIIKVTEENFDEVNSLLMSRYGKSIELPKEETVVGIKVGVPNNPIVVVSKEAVQKAEELKEQTGSVTKPTTEKAKAKAKGVVKK